MRQFLANLADLFDLGMMILFGLLALVILTCCCWTVITSLMNPS